MKVKDIKAEVMAFLEQIGEYELDGFECSINFVDEDGYETEEANGKLNIAFRPAFDFGEKMGTKK